VAANREKASGGLGKQNIQKFGSAFITTQKGRAGSFDDGPSDAVCKVGFRTPVHMNEGFSLLAAH